MSIPKGNANGRVTRPGPCLYDLLRGEKFSWTKRERFNRSGAQKKLEKLLTESGNNICADCGAPDPKWVSLNHGIFICIKCSQKPWCSYIKVKLDDWTEEQVNSMTELGGNTRANKKYELCIPDYIKKPKPDASIEERSDFIRRKYEQLQFFDFNENTACISKQTSSSSSSSTSLSHVPTASERKQLDKQPTRHRIGSAFRNSWARKDSENRHTKKINSLAGMVEFVGLIKVNVARGTNLAVRDVVTSDPYVILALGGQSVKTRVIKNNLNPVWNESLMLSIPEQVPPLKVDTFSTDDFMGEAEIDIQPLISGAKAYEGSTINESMQVGKWVACSENTLVKDGVISLVDGKVKQEISLRLQKVERGVVEIELECVPLTQ